MIRIANDITVEKAKEQINTRTIRRYDPGIRKLLFSASYVRIFVFDIHKYDWVRHNIDGVCFIYCSHGDCIAKLFVLNRSGFDNLIIPIDNNTDMQLLDTFLIMRTSNRVIYGVWFHSEFEYAKAKDVLQALMAKRHGSITAVKEPNCEAVNIKLDFNKTLKIDTAANVNIDNIEKNPVGNIKMKEKSKLKEKHFTGEHIQNLNFNTAENLKPVDKLENNALHTPVADKFQQLQSNILNFSYETSPYSLENIEIQQKLNSRLPGKQNIAGTRGVYNHSHSDYLNFSDEDFLNVTQDIHVEHQSKSPAEISLNDTKILNDDTVIDTAMKNERKVSLGNETPLSTGDKFSFTYENCPYSLENIEKKATLLPKSSTPISIKIPVASLLVADMKSNSEYADSKNGSPHLYDVNQLTYENSPYSLKNIEIQQKLNS